jgi:phosphoglucomutase
MPTSAALDVVAKNLNLKFFEVKYYDHQLLVSYMGQICMKKTHVSGAYWVEIFREPDGCWNVLSLW